MSIGRGRGRGREREYDDDAGVDARGDDEGDSTNATGGFARAVDTRSENGEKDANANGGGERGGWSG